MLYFIKSDISKDQREQLFAAGHCFSVTRKVEVKDPPTKFEIDLECIDPRVDNNWLDNWYRENSGSACKPPYSEKFLHLFISIYIFDTIAV